jgi:bifunctional ADP-heptose synthase (sugar kinase/adenylyltransferase)
VFTEHLRAEMVASLEAVDYVGISPNPGAEHVIETIKPSVYLKGSEYSVEENDVTGRIVTERTLVERFGGTVLYTEDITFSSSNLGNRILHLYPKEAQEYLNRLRERLSYDDLLSRINAVRDKRCLIIGDTILDEYIYVDSLSKPSKENILSTLYREREIFCGGVLATANMVAQFCDHVDVVTLLGRSESQEEFIRGSLDKTINLVPFYREGARTTVKSRLVDSGYFKKLMEIAYLTDEPLPDARQNELNSWIEERLNDYDVVIVNDFGHGMID